MKIKVGLNQKSIKNATKALKNTQKLLKGEMLDEFYKKCYDYFVSRANLYLQSSGIGGLVINDIQSSWHYEKTISGVKFTNDAEKAVYVEFGVGIGGQSSPHYNANEVGYQYNVDSFSKNADGSWFFRSSLSELDIPLENVEQQSGNENQMIFQTWGTPATMYAFNALEDLRLQIPKTWEEIKIKYWG